MKAIIAEHRAELQEADKKMEAVYARFTQEKEEAQFEMLRQMQEKSVLIEEIKQQNVSAMKELKQTHLKQLEVKAETHAIEINQRNEEITHLQMEHAKREKALEEEFDLKA